MIAAAFKVDHAIFILMSLIAGSVEKNIFVPRRGDKALCGEVIPLPVTKRETVPARVKLPAFSKRDSSIRLFKRIF